MTLSWDQKEAKYLAVQIFGAKCIPGRGTSGAKALRYKNTRRCSKTGKRAKRRGEDREAGVSGGCIMPGEPSKDFGFYSVVKAVSGLEQRSGTIWLRF